MTTFDKDRPLLRGYSHLLAAALAPGFAIPLIVLARSGVPRLGAAAFGSSLTLMYVASAAYHRSPPTWRRLALLQRLDHALIFVFIAGTYAPVCLVMPDRTRGLALLLTASAVALAGASMKIARPEMQRWYGVALYLSAGWVALASVWQLAAWLSTPSLTLLTLGGAAYTAGAVIYAVRLPNPFPRVFGYHEVFHLLVVAGSATHAVLIAALLLTA